MLNKGHAKKKQKKIYKYQAWRAVNDKQSRHILRRLLKVMKKISTGGPGAGATLTPALNTKQHQLSVHKHDSEGRESCRHGETAFSQPKITVDGWSRRN